MCAACGLRWVRQVGNGDAGSGSLLAPSTCQGLTPSTSTSPSPVRTCFHCISCMYREHASTGPDKQYMRST